MQIRKRRLLESKTQYRIIKEGELPFEYLQYIFIPDIQNAVKEKREEIKAYAVGESELKEFTLTLGELTDDEREIILKGCLINYYKG